MRTDRDRALSLDKKKDLEMRQMEEKIKHIAQTKGNTQKLQEKLKVQTDQLSKLQTIKYEE